jgi:stage III sporulation protein SpoIIIAA
VSSQKPTETTDDLRALLGALPPEILAAIDALPPERDLIEVVMDLGRAPEARFGGGGEQVLREREIDDADLQYVVDHIGTFGDDNRAGIERTLHRISAIRNRSGKVVGLTARIGRAVFGTIEIIEDFVESGKSILIMGRPGIGKTTMLREAARVLADDVDKRVVVVDTSNEIAGDGDIPHPGIGRARRMQVPTPSMQHQVMIEAVENHMPEVIVIDEIGTELEAAAARTIAERGVQLIGTAHGNNLDNLMLNPTLSDLIGGIQSVTLGDEEARRRRTQKSVLERKAPPTFDVIIEIQDRDRVMVHGDVAETVDAMLRGDPVAPELRWRDEAGVHRTQARPRPSPNTTPGATDRFSGLVGGGTGWRMDVGWRPDLREGGYGYRDAERGRSGFRSGGTGGGWRAPRGRSGGGPVRGTPSVPGDARDGDPAARLAGAYDLGRLAETPFVTGGLADRGPLERGTPPAPEPPARVARELGRQREWRQAAQRVIDTLHAEDGTGPVPDAAVAPALPGPVEFDAETTSDFLRADLEADFAAEDGEDAQEGDEVLAFAAYDADGALAPDAYATSLPTLRVLGYGISHKRLEQAIRELQLPVLIVRDLDEADIVITLRTAYRQKPPTVREAEEMAKPIYVLKANTVIQIQACITSLYSLEVDPREAALRETEEAIGLVVRQAKPIELSPQNAFIRRLQHQMAERANLVSRSRGREPYRRVRLYPDQVRAWK